jgi:hypothetical protein
MERNHKLFKLTSAILASALLLGCEANGIGNGGLGGDGGGITGGGAGGIFPNDGTTPTTVGEDGNGDGVVDVPGETLPGNFICSTGVGPAATTSVSTGQVVGADLTDLLNGLGGGSAAALLNSVTDRDLAIDLDLETYSRFVSTLGGLGALDTVEQVVSINGVIPVGQYAVFAVSFPLALLEASVLHDVIVTTFRGEAAQESITFDATTIDLLGAVGTVAPIRAFIGLKATKPYDQVSIGISSGVLSVNVGDAMYVHELCTDGRFVTAP